MNIENVKNILIDIPIFWINLSRAKERRNNILSVFQKYNLINERVDAIDGSNINLEEYKKVYNINEKISIYEIACALSHLKVIKLCYEKNLDYALILEDDATFEYFDYKKETLKELLDELLKIDGECIQLCNIISRKCFSSIINNNNLLIKGYFSGAQAYLITKKGMKKILDNFENTKYISISEELIFNNINNYIVKPYFSYPFLNHDNKKNPSFIRDNTKSAHATQTINKQLWDEYYKTLSPLT